MVEREVDTVASDAMWRELDAFQAPVQGAVEQPVVMEPGISQQALVASLAACGVALAACVGFIAAVWVGMLR